MNRVIVAIIIYNRFDNLQRWIDCWKKSKTDGAELVIIHNYESKEDLEKYSEFCRLQNVRYVARINRGFDIGAFQDVCRERLPLFPNDWNLLLWITDDVIPMTRDFISPFIHKIEEAGNGIACMEISKEVVQHVRTTGFMIRKEIASQLSFPADPIVDKWQCYLFEHRGGDQTLISQVNKLGYQAAAVAPINTSPLWDTELKRSKQLKRMPEHIRAFRDKPEKVTFICPAYQCYPQIISSMLCQTYPHWELIIIHDGPNSTGLREIVERYNDQRISYIETEKRSGNWGHSIRREWIKKMKDHDTDYIVVTNADNYHVPVFTEYMLKGFDCHPDTVATYCTKMVHSYRAWDAQNCSLARGYIDCAGAMIKKKYAVEVGWNDVSSHSADWFFFKDIMDKYGSHLWAMVPGCLLIHN